MQWHLANGYQEAGVLTADDELIFWPAQLVRIPHPPPRGSLPSPMFPNRPAPRRTLAPQDIGQGEDQLHQELP